MSPTNRREPGRKGQPARRGQRAQPAESPHQPSLFEQADRVNPPQSMAPGDQGTPEPAHGPTQPPVQLEPSPLALALIEALPRLCGAHGAGGSPAQHQPDRTLVELIGAMAAALERGELELALTGPAPAGIDPQGWPQRHRQALASSPLAVDARTLAERPEAPLVWSGGRLRWRRWHLQWETCIGQLTARAQAPLPEPLDPAAVDQAVAQAATQGLDRQQQQAVTALLRHRLVLLGGGPGTGKTSTVVQMLGAVLSQRPELRLHLAAPTGKAAARLRTTLQEGGKRLAPPLAERLGRAPCTTLHRLLESSGDRFGRNRRHRLALDLVVVDELSMVDLPLMAALLEALPEACQLLLVGDPAQLPPVGPGAVLQELSQSERLAALGDAAIELKTTYRNNGAIAAFAAALRPGSQQALGKPERSDALIGLEPEDALTKPRQLAREAATPTPSPTESPASEDTANKPAAGLAALLKGLSPDDNLIWQPHPPGRLPAEALERLRRHQQRLQALAEAIDWPAWGAQTSTGGPTRPKPSRTLPPGGSPNSAAPGSAPDAPCPDPAAALLAELEACVLLSPVRQGAWGVEAVHRQLLGEAASQPIQHWPLGTPVLCQRNLAEEGLANGDIGVLVERAGERLVLFPGPFPSQPAAAPGGGNSNAGQGDSPSDSPGARLVHPARLGAAEPALALTIHKSQGSQYQEVVLLIPPTRHWDPRLLYTGLTRARQRAWLITPHAPSWLAADGPARPD